MIVLVSSVYFKYDNYYKLQLLTKVKVHSIHRVPFSSLLSSYKTKSCQFSLNFTD